MRPHHLRLVAFGSFAGEQELDLDALAANGLFLLHGETGAGKTTLLDAICFALYGRVPRYGSAAGRLRSDHADAAVRTEVQLEVSLGGRRLRITRRPQQERPKTRGTGSTTEQAQVRLEEWRGEDWEPLSQRLDETGAELESLLGMTADQFQQVVLLPQGEFATFLKARTTERTQLLQRLFSTERFRSVEDWLAARRQATASQVAEARHELDVLEARFAEAAGVDRPTEPDSGFVAGPATVAGTCSQPGIGIDLDSGVDLDSGAGTALRGACGVAPQWAADLLVLTRTEAGNAAEETAQARALLSQARSALEEVRALQSRQTRRRQHQQVLDELDRVQPGRDALGAELAAASRAAELAGAVREADRREDERVAAVRAATTARARLAEAGVPVGATDLRERADAAARRIGLLDGLRDAAADLANDRALAAELARQTLSTGRELAELAAALRELPSRVAEAERRVMSARTAQVAAPDARLEAKGLRMVLVDCRRRDEQAVEHTRLREERLSARERVATLRETADALRRARLDSMIAELADTLASDQPCPVCGATEHPDPYLGDSDRVTLEQEEQAQLAADQAQDVVADLDRRLAVVEAALVEVTGRLVSAGLGDDERLLSEELAEAVGRVEGLERQAADLPAAEQDLETVSRIHDQARERHAELAGSVAGLQERADEMAGRVDRAEADLARQLDGARDLATALEQARRCEERCTTAAAATAQAERAADEARAALTSLTAAALAAGFTDVDEVRAALRTPEQREAGERRRREHDEARAGALAALADPELAIAPGPDADQTATVEAVGAAEAALSTAERAQARAEARVTALERLSPDLDAATAALRPLAEDATRVRALADLCAGTATANTLRMSLTAFVLAARLEEVAAAASARLLRMSQGRFALVHTDGTAARGVRSGLGLLARDTWTGQDRETSTLSGGETFLASLALALGLADVVQAEAGGARIEALFVDEGFGTLDEETLDEVMDVLDGLREGGRVVGVVSHVAELRDRIPARVRVRKGRSGSSLEVHGVTPEPVGA